MPKRLPSDVSRRERQIMDIVFRQGRATVSDVLDQMRDPPGYSAVRAMMKVLEDKGHLRHQQDGLAYVYFPTVSLESASRSAVSHLLRTFFQGSAERAVAAVLQSSASKLSDDELRRIAQMVDAARKEEGR
jgi:BlaI family penicillinase repressor